tara:strand:- start:225 stop:395 length:171 start_codon:yes stop_codon:yes gene_type:complete
LVKYSSFPIFSDTSISFDIQIVYAGKFLFQISGEESSTFFTAKKETSRMREKRVCF